MRATSVVATAALVALLAGGSHADAPRPTRTFLFQALSYHVEVCSGLGGEWLARVSRSLALAKGNTKGFLPEEMWDALILISSRAKEGQAAERRQFVNCEPFIGQLSDPNYRFHVRGDTANGLLAVPIYRCMVEFPDLAEELRASWMGAFSRNNFRMTDAEVTAGLDEWRRRGVKPRPPEDSHKLHCRDFIRFLWDEFDTFFSEDKITKILLEDLDKR